MKDNIGNNSGAEQSSRMDYVRLRALLRRVRAEPQGVSLFDVLSCLVGVAQDQDGSQLLQEHLPQATKEVQAIVFGAALPELVTLSLHQHGHAFVLCLLDAASSQQKKMIAEQLAAHVKALTLDSHGCRVIQKAVKVFSQESCEQLIEGLKECATACIKNMHGNHVMQVCIEELPSASVSFIVEAISEWGVDNASSHMYACRVVMRLLEHAQQQMQDVLHLILQSVPRLAKDRYGNYVLQHILEHGEISSKRQLISHVIKCGVPMLATQKYSHNVIEKCIGVAWCPEYEAALELERVALTSQFFPTDGDSPIVALAGERFGSMVVEHLMDHLKGAQLEKLECLLRDVETYLQEKDSATSILAKIQAKC